MAWRQLLAIEAEAVELAEAERARPPLDCPTCLTPLRGTAKGVLYCPFDGWRAGG
jgi:hypothetical protein